jgi:hypothetical protein
VLSGGIYKISYNTLNTSYFNSHLPTFFFIPFPILELFQKICFLFKYMCTQYLHHIHPPTFFPYHLPPHTGINPFPHPRVGPVLPSYSPILYKKKTRYLCLHKIATQGISLWHFHVYMYCSQLGSSPLFSSFYQFKNSDSFLYREYISHIHLLNFLLLQSPFHM